MWLNQLKIAIVEKNTDKISELMENLPQLEIKEEIEQALYLTQEATNLIYSLQKKTSTSMRQMKKNIEFLKSTQAPRRGKLDIKS